MLRAHTRTPIFCHVNGEDVEYCSACMKNNCVEFLQTTGREIVFTNDS